MSVTSTSCAVSQTKSGRNPRVALRVSERLMRILALSRRALDLKLPSFVPVYAHRVRSVSRSQPACTGFLSPEHFLFCEHVSHHYALLKFQSLVLGEGYSKLVLRAIGVWFEEGYQPWILDIALGNFICGIVLDDVAEQTPATFPPFSH